MVPIAPAPTKLHDGAGILGARAVVALDLELALEGREVDRRVNLTFCGTSL
jgi:hypothetical protein